MSIPNWKGKIFELQLNLDFANILRFSPKNTAGIVVYRLPRNPTLIDFELLTKQLLNALETMSTENNFWIVEIRRLRLHD
jgi:hypothetical protein